MGFRSQPHRSNPLLSFNIALLYLLRMRPSPQAGRGPSYEPHPLVHTYGAWWLCEVLLAPFDGKLYWTNILFFYSPTIDIQAQWRRGARNAAQLE